LTKPAAELDFTLFVVSPTGLCKNRKVQLSCYSNRPEIVTGQALKLIEQVSSEVRTNLASGQRRTFSQQEFEEFRRQAFQLMPNTPSVNDYSKNQIDTVEELEPALHLLECAMLFKGDDIPVLVCAGNVLNGMSQDWNDNISDTAKENFHKAAIDFIERAYLLESNPNTRDSYYEVFINRIPPSIEASEHIWNTRKEEHWTNGQVLAAVEKLLASGKDNNWLSEVFIQAAREYGENSVGGFSNLFHYIRVAAIESKDLQQFRQEFLKVSKLLVTEESPLLRFIGHMLYLELYFERKDETRNITNAPIEFAGHFRDALNAAVEVSKTHKYGMSIYYNNISNLFYTYERVLKKYNLEDDSADLKEKFLIFKIKTSLFPGDIMNDLNSLLPQLYEHGKYEQGYDLLAEYLEGAPEGGGTMLDQTRLIRMLNRFYFAMQDGHLYSL
ncbi:MAG: hypothetical protein P8016_15680, partial [Sedimentisphaerales bacterium]